MLRAGLALSPPLRTIRIRACIAVLLLLVLGLAQAVHHHDLWLPHANAGAGANLTVDAPDVNSTDVCCSLCMALHVSQPEATRYQLPLLRQAAAPPAVLPAIRRAHGFVFSLFGRPPPFAA